MSTLNDISDKNPFKVPDNYFEEVNRKIISSSPAGEREVIKISFYNRFRTGILVAASLTGFILLSYGAFRIFFTNRPVPEVSEVIRNINTDSLINEIDISSLEENASEMEIADQGPDVSKKDIIDYLLLNNVEINEIYEHL